MEGHRKSGIINQHSETARLRLRLLTPLVALIVILVLILAISLFYFESDSLSDGLLHQRLTRTQTLARHFYENSVLHDTNALKTVLDALRQDQELARIFATYNRDELLAYSQRLFTQLRRDYNITHFYFTQPDRVNLLRVHMPARYGDTIERITTLRAEKKQSVSDGVELGILGTFTLRVVSPWYDQNGELIGYVELGMEIDHVIDYLRNVFDFNVVVVIYKAYLQREQWEQGMALLGHDHDWNKLAIVVLASVPSDGIPDVLIDHYRRGIRDKAGDVTRLQHNGTSYRLITVPIEDASGRQVAEISLLSDVSQELGLVRQTALVTGMATLVLGGLLIIFFWRQTERVGLRIEQDETVLKQLAARDALTGLYNRRVFQQLLENELFRSDRFEHPVSVLMVDIDHFKQVNDRYGHQAGDLVLMEISNRLKKSVRNVDHVCRYGGEEFVIVLPETELEYAQAIAAKIRKVISALGYDIEQDRLIPVTISIGIATYPGDADSDTLLIAAADSALYKAKESGRDRICAYRELAEPVV